MSSISFLLIRQHFWVQTDLEHPIKQLTEKLDNTDVDEGFYNKSFAKSLDNFSVTLSSLTDFLQICFREVKLRRLKYFKPISDDIRLEKL